MNEFPLVSVVIPAHNATAYLATALQSVIHQSLQQIEVIVVDDGSTDDTRAVALHFAEIDDRVRVYSTAKRGVAAAFNFGLRKTKSRFIARMDADDSCLTERLAEQYLYLVAHPSVYIVGSQAIEIDKSGVATGRVQVPTGRWAINMWIRLASPLVTPSTMVRKELYEAIGGWRNLSPGADYEFYLRAWRYGYRICNSAKTYLHYRNVGTGVSTQNLARTAMMQRAIRRHYRSSWSVAETVYRKVLHQERTPDAIRFNKYWVLRKRQLTAATHRLRPLRLWYLATASVLTFGSRLLFERSAIAVACQLLLIVDRAISHRGGERH